MPSTVKRFLAALFFALVCLNAEAVPGGGGVRLKKVVIDAGHGGVDPGCLSQDRRLREKDITLDVAKRLGAYIKEDFPDLDVIYTRSRDVQVELNSRADIANRNDADVFISIHVNSAPQSPKASGSETFIMGGNKSAANMAVCRAENSVILLEDDYKTRYEGFDPSDPESYIFMNLMQNAFFEQSLSLAADIQKSLAKGPVNVNRGIKQGGLLVLWRTAMPAVLVELGFISNAADRKVLASADGRDRLSRRVADAFGEFKKRYDNNVNVEEVRDSVPSGPTGASAAAVADTVREEWKIQIFAVRAPLKSGDRTFRGEKDAEPVRSGGYYKYCVGSFSSRKEAVEALPQYRKKFKDCFVVRLNEDGTLTR